MNPTDRDDEPIVTPVPSPFPTATGALTHRTGIATVSRPYVAGSPNSTRIDRRTCRVTSAASPTAA